MRKAEFNAFKERGYHGQKHPSCNKSVDMLQRLVTTSRYQDVFACMACDSLTTSLLQDVNRLVAS